MHHYMEAVFSILVLLTGLGCVALYFRKHRGVESAIGKEIIGHRPWRKIGAALVCLLSISYVLGVQLVDVPKYPRAYACYWVVFLGLVFWLCVLALRDLQYTRKMIADLQARHRDKMASLTMGLPDNGNEND